MSDLSAWVLSIGSFAAIVLLTAFAAKSFAGEPTRGRRRCPRCWHELGPAPAADSPDDEALRARRCAECGFTAARESDTLRTRRRIGLGILAVAAILAIVAAARIRFLDQGPWGAVPTRVLLALSPYAGDGGYRSIQSELTARIRAGLLDDAQLRDTVELVVAGDGDAPAGGAAWRRKYDDLAFALLATVPRQDPLTLRFLEIPPELVVSFLGAASGSPSLLAVDALDSWPRGVESKLTIEFADGTVRHARFNPASRSNRLIVEVPPSVGPGGSVRFVLAVRPAGDAADGPWIEYPTVVAQIPTILGRAADEPDARPIDSPELREAVTGVFFPDHALTVWNAGTPRAGLQFNNAPAMGLDFSRTLFGLRVEICENGVARRTSRIWWHGGGGEREARWLAPVEDLEALARLAAQDPALDANWTIRITGDRSLADYARPPVAEAPDRSAFSYWSGSVEFPLKVMRAGTPSPPRRWTLE